MSSGRIERLLRSTSARLATLYAVLLIAGFVIAGIAAWLVTGTAAEEAIRERVELEMAAVQREWRGEGADDALASIRSRNGQPGSLEYCVWDEDNRLRDCDLDIAMPVLGWNRLALRDQSGAQDHEVLLLAQQTPSGGVLAVADSLQHAERGRPAVLEAILWSGGLSLLLALAAGVVAARGALRRMDALNDTLTLAGAGDFSRRAPERPGGDDIDAMARGLNQMLARTEGLVANIKRVSTDIAHDLRTPLTHVRQKLEGAAQAHDVAAAQEAIRTAQSEIDDVLRTFSAMLRLAEIEVGGARIRFTEVQLPALVERVVDAYRPDIEANGQSLRLDVAPVGSVEGDSDLIAQALANLLENAMRHAGANAALEVRLGGSPGELRLEVADNGVGVPRAEHARIVEPFVRLDSSRSTPGAGLGLSIVAAIARLHRADLLFENAAPGLRAVLRWRREH